MNDETVEYLGDEVIRLQVFIVSVRFDGYKLWLSTPLESGTHEIALEPSVYENLVQYVERLKKSVQP